MCLFEYDDEREIELIRKAEFQEGVKAGQLERTGKILQAILLIQQKHPAQNISKQTGLEMKTIQEMLNLLKESMQ
ncbi:hypothetical protein [uncultured Clostridium sp.]|uniref:hypothetical protein n=1 Tax=uncultured Clostridium sp. TaxID=59620 RepID=UPI0025D0ADA7|nr:hypothetical protein [uncultured Clostridium sp.]